MDLEVIVGRLINNMGLEVQQKISMEVPILKEVKNKQIPSNQIQHNSKDFQ
jgi:hypothetical protein